MLSDRQTRGLATRFQRRLAALAATAAPTVIDSFERFGPNFDAVEPFATEVAPILMAAKSTAVRYSTAFYGIVLGVRPDPIDPTTVATAPAYRDPFIAYWRAINSDRPTIDAWAAGAARAEAITVDHIVSSSRRTGDLVAAATDTRPMWRRLPDGNACDWCRGLAAELWDSAAAADFGHDRCGCTPIPVQV